MKPYYQDSHVTIYNGDCRSMGDLADNSIQCCVTSPPYWGLRKYAGNQDLIWGENYHEHDWVTVSTYHGNGGGGNSPEFGTRHNSETWNNIHDTKDRNIYTNTCSLCGAWRGAYGLEPTPELYVQHSIEILREIRRVLRKDGVCFWNVGDSYNGSGGDHKPGGKNDAGFQGESYHGTQPRNYKSLKPKDLCLIPFRVAIAAQTDGWWVRSVIIWSKNNPMPESVKDRPTESHEYIFMLTKSSKYYWDREAVKEKGVMVYGDSSGSPQTDTSINYGIGCGNTGINKAKEKLAQELKVNGVSSRNCRSVWEFSTHGYPEAHFATFPEALPERCIKAGSKEGDVILDPFAGSGTTLWVAKKMNRKAVGYELSTEYCELANKRNLQQVML